MGLNNIGTETDLRPGKRFLLETGELTVLSRIRKVTHDTVHVSVPFADYPVTGMTVAMEFHDSDGCTQYKATVVQGPILGTSAAILARPTECQRVQHRSYTRVSANLPILFREMSKVKFLNAVARNVSAGGFLLETKHRIKAGSPLEVQFSVEKGVSMTVLGTVVHVVKPPRGKSKDAQRLYGFEFTNIEQRERQAIIEYVWDILENTQQLASRSEN